MSGIQHIQHVKLRHVCEDTKTSKSCGVIVQINGRDTLSETRTFGDFRRKGSSNGSPFVAIVPMSCLVLRSDA